MKFSDIEQYIQGGNWECNYSLERLIAVIDNWCAGEDAESPLQMMPDFQRGHVWNEKQQASYVEALLRDGAKNARVIYLNNPGWMKEPTTSYRDFVCVDGLQRYEAIRKFIQNELRVLGHFYREFEGNLRTRHDLKINVNSLQTKQEVLQWYLQMNSGGTPHSKAELDRVQKMLIEETCGGE